MSRRILVLDGATGTGLEALEKYAGNRRVVVAGSMGPTNKSISVTGGITFDELSRSFRIHSEGLISGGVDYLLLETQQDTITIIFSAPG